jgi:hypothetical protein
MKLNKRAIMDDMFDFIVTIAAAIVILLFMSVSLSGGGREKIVSGNLGSFDAGNSLLAYLKSPISDTENMADLIIRWHYNQDKYAGELRSESMKILKRLPVPSVSSEGWNIRIFSPDDVEEIEIAPSKVIGYYESWNTFASLPLIEGGKHLKVEIHLECQDEMCN